MFALLCADRVRADVPGAVGSICEGFLALGAAEGSDSAVQARVRDEVMLLREVLVASGLRAAEALDSAVDAQVAVAVGGARELAEAQVAVEKALGVGGGAATLGGCTPTTQRHVIALGLAVVRHAGHTTTAAAIAAALGALRSTLLLLVVERVLRSAVATVALLLLQLLLLLVWSDDCHAAARSRG